MLFVFVLCSELHRDDGKGYGGKGGRVGDMGCDGVVVVVGGWGEGEGGKGRNIAKDDTMHAEGCTHDTTTKLYQQHPNPSPPPQVAQLVVSWTLLSTKIGKVTLMRPIHGNL